MAFRWWWQRRLDNPPPLVFDPPAHPTPIDLAGQGNDHLGERLHDQLTTWRLANPRPENDREEPDVTDTYDPATEDQSMDPSVADPRHAAADDAPTERLELGSDQCPHCLGTGRTLTTNDHLRMSIDLLGDKGDEVVAEFYDRLLAEAPGLAPLFPDDLTDPLAGAGSPGRLQRDRLLGALVAVSQTYDRTNPRAMEILDTHLGTFGRSHANFQRPDGSVRGASLAEYHAVKVVLFATLHDAAGEAWRPEFDDAWSEAYDYAVGEMLHAQNHTDMTAARYPRPSPRPR